MHLRILSLVLAVYYIRGIVARPQYGTYPPGSSGSSGPGSPPTTFAPVTYPPGTYPPGGYPQGYYSGAYPQGNYPPGTYNPNYPRGPWGGNGPFVPILEQSFDLDPSGSYRWSFSSGDGTAQEAEGSPSGPGGAVVSRGSAQWVGTDGPVRLDYVADEFGYQPVGTHVHPSIARAVAQQVAEAKAQAPYISQPPVGPPQPVGPSHPPPPPPPPPQPPVVQSPTGPVAVPPTPPVAPVLPPAGDAPAPSAAAAA